MSTVIQGSNSSNCLNDHQNNESDHDEQLLKWFRNLDEAENSDADANNNVQQPQGRANREPQPVDGLLNPGNNWNEL